MDETHAALQWAHERVDITPPLGLPMGGYASRGTTGCRAIEDRLQCDTLLLAQGKTRFLAPPWT
ncbi:MAG: hypothetical protein GX161_13785 [Firmicutes bacterium]|nr:hypothetical protein [Bacillota bacterium]